MTAPDNCVLWTGPVSYKGYGVAKVGNTTTTAHRLAWITAYGPIAAGLQVDHLCGNRRCVNLAHLELVTPSENTRRAAWAQVIHCKRGHPLEGENLCIQVDKYGRTHRSCRICRRDYRRGIVA